MGNMKDLYTEGVTDLVSYNMGIMAERIRIVKMLEGFEKDYGYDMVMSVGFMSLMIRRTGEANTTDFTGSTLPISQE